MESYMLEAKRYFTEEQWNVFEASEQLKYGQVCYIYFACVHLGISVVTPHFMCKQKDELQTENEKMLNKCKFCKTNFSSKENTRNHMKVCKNRFDFIKERRYACKECNFHTDVLHVLKRHCLTHTQKKMYTCDFCKKSFLSDAYLKKHINRVHTKAKEEYMCDTCSYKTIHKGDLRLVRHKKVHSDIKTYICEICNKGFNRKQYLAQHLFNHGNKEKPFQCLECEKSFVTKQRLAVHMNAVHLKIKKFKCSLCEYSTATKCNLKRHTYTHLNEPF